MFFAEIAWALACCSFYIFLIRVRLPPSLTEVDQSITNLRSSVSSYTAIAFSSILSIRIRVHLLPSSQIGMEHPMPSSGVFTWSRTSTIKNMVRSNQTNEASRWFLMFQQVQLSAKAQTSSSSTQSRHYMVFALPRISSLSPLTRIQTSTKEIGSSSRGPIL